MEKALDVISSVSFLVLLWALIRGESVAWSRYNTLMKVIGGLKFRLFDLEARVLSADGIFVPEDMAERYSKFVQSQLTEEDLKAIQERYEKEGPSHVPFWKYVITHYRLDVSVSPYGLIATISPELEAVRAKMLSQISKIQELSELMGRSKLDMKSLTESVQQLSDAFSTMKSDIAETEEASSSEVTKTSPPRKARTSKAK